MPKNWRSPPLGPLREGGGRGGGGPARITKAYGEGGRKEEAEKDGELYLETKMEKKREYPRVYLCLFFLLSLLKACLPRGCNSLLLLR